LGRGSDFANVVEPVTEGRNGVIECRGICKALAFYAFCFGQRIAVFHICPLLFADSNAS